MRLLCICGEGDRLLCVSNGKIIGNVCPCLSVHLYNLSRFELGFWFLELKTSDFGHDTTAQACVMLNI